jgi:hypothetical protein
MATDRHPVPLVWRWLARVCRVGAFPYLVACASDATESESRNAAHSSNGLEVGAVYTVEQPVQAITRGTRKSLVPADALKPPDDSAARTAEISPGTRIRVTGIRDDNTITHGIETWPEGTILNGPHVGQTVSLGHKELPQILQPSKP